MLIFCVHSSLLLTLNCYIHNFEIFSSDGFSPPPVQQSSTKPIHFCFVEVIVNYYWLWHINRLNRVNKYYTLWTDITNFFLFVRWSVMWIACAQKAPIIEWLYPIIVFHSPPPSPAADAAASWKRMAMCQIIVIRICIFFHLLSFRIIETRRMLSTGRGKMGERKVLAMIEIGHFNVHPSVIKCVYDLYWFIVIINFIRASKTLAIASWPRERWALGDGWHEKLIYIFNMISSAYTFKKLSKFDL